MQTIRIRSNCVPYFLRVSLKSGYLFIIANIERREKMQRSFPIYFVRFVIFSSPLALEDFQNSKITFLFRFRLFIQIIEYVTFAANKVTNEEKKTESYLFSKHHEYLYLV